MEGTKACRCKGLGGLGDGGWVYKVLRVENIEPDIWLNSSWNLSEKGLAFVAYLNSLSRKANLFGSKSDSGIRCPCMLLEPWRHILGSA